MNDVECRVETLTSVLELSKLHLYYFHCNHMQGKYPLTEQFTDTDSLAYALQRDDTSILMILRVDMASLSILSTILFMIHLGRLLAKIKIIKNFIY